MLHHNSEAFFYAHYYLLFALVIIQHSCAETVIVFCLGQINPYPIQVIFTDKIFCGINGTAQKKPWYLNMPVQHFASTAF
jgi:hypothetical protein